jgi:hypothetical protein
LATLLKGGLVADHSQHAADAGRAFGVAYVQFDIKGKLAVMAVGA